MSIQTQIDRINNAKNNLKKWLEDNKITVPTNALIDEMVALLPISSSYTNQVPISIDTDGSVFNGKGYIGKTRLSSSGVTKEGSGVTTTGYIKAKAKDVVRIGGNCTFDGTNCYVCTYNSSFGFIKAINGQGSYGGGTLDKTGAVPKVTLLNDSNIAYIRVSADWNSSVDGYYDSADPTQGPCEHLIVTVNEEITD